jgi:hypothetical protein
VQVRFNYREPRIIEREPDAPDNLTEREPKLSMIASRAADNLKPLQVVALVEMPITFAESTLVQRQHRDTDVDGRYTPSSFFMLSIRSSASTSSISKFGQK